MTRTVRDGAIILGALANSKEDYTRYLDKDGLRALVDKHRDRIKSGVVVLASPSDGKVSIVVGVTPDLTKKVPAGQVVKQLAPIVGGG